MGRRVLSGTGRILVAKKGKDLATWIGNAEAATLNFEEDNVDQPNHFALGGGVYATMTRIGSGTIDITALELTKTALEVGFASVVSQRAAGAKADQLHSVGAGKLSRFAFMLDTSATVTPALGVEAWADATVYASETWSSASGKYWYTVAGGTSSGTSPADDTGVTWVDMGASPTVPSESDFTKTPAGVTLDESYSWPEGAPLKFSYTSKATMHSEAQVNSAQEWRIIFDGFNEGESGEPMIVDVHSAKFAAQSFEILGQDFSSIPLSGTMQADLTKTGTNESKFYFLEHADAA